MIMKRTLSGEKKKVDEKKNRFLVTINVVGSAGPIRFVVKEEELVAAVIDTALKTYAGEGRLPLLGSDPNNFFLYCANSGSDALDTLERIGSGGGRNFVMCKKKQTQPQMRSDQMVAAHKGSGWKAWLNKSSALRYYCLFEHGT